MSSHHTGEIQVEPRELTELKKHIWEHKKLKAARVTRTEDHREENQTENPRDLQPLHPCLEYSPENRSEKHTGICEETGVISIRTVSVSTSKTGKEKRK